MNEQQQMKTIQSMLKKMPISRHDVLFVHSAFKSFTRDGYTPNTALKVLIDHLEPGTLLLPTMSWRYVKPDKPFFDEQLTPSNTGILTELFRQQHATHRSLHPTHSVAGVGSQAAAILSAHHLCTTPCGDTSPFAKLVEADAYIIMLGVGMDCCTLIHHAEEKIAPQYYVRPESETEAYECRDRHGNTIPVKLRRHQFLPRNYWQFQDRLAEKNALTVSRCDNSICIGFRAKKLFQIVTDALKWKPDIILAKPGQRYRLM